MSEKHRLVYQTVNKNPSAPRAGVVAPPGKLFPNWTKVSLRATHDWQIKFKQANEKHSSEQVLHFPPKPGNSGD